VSLAADDSAAGSLQPTVLVTGAAGGVGTAVAHRFAEGGWDVVVTDVDAVGARRTADSAGAVAALPADLCDVARCRGVVAATVEATGRLDCLVNAAGVWTEGPTEDTLEADFDRVLGVNLKGLYFVTAAAIPHLARAHGCVVNLSSDAGVQGNAGAAVYCASKGAVSILTKALALELAPRGVRVNAVCPGDIDTPMLRAQAASFGESDPAGYLRRLLAGYPQGSTARFVLADEVAELVWYLAQPEAAPITGANLAIDFGLSAGTWSAQRPQEAPE
jgi:NAD(P)-dependent dehydrogenase (short-subunit alcohol dehydrogenase family)